MTTDQDPEELPQSEESQAKEETPSSELRPEGLVPKPDASAPPPVTENSAYKPPSPELLELRESVDQMKGEIQRIIVGQDKMIDLLLVALFSGGHVLLEGVPGIAKTLTAKLLSKALSVDFSRIQFTPDLMPTDITGTSVFNMKTSEFNFKKGPIFSNLILIDEINRAPAKTQAALFEVMEELQLTIDGKTYKMDQPFMVMATQNPIEQEGTYQLPEAQLDRFLFRIVIDYPQQQEEVEILRRFKSDFSQNQVTEVKSVLNSTKIQRCRDIVEKIGIRDELLQYIASIVINTRNNGDLFLGASPRASLAILKSAKAMAAIQGRDFVTPDDIKTVAFPVLNHRIILTPDREMEGVTINDVLKEILEKVEVPR